MGGSSSRDFSRALDRELAALTNGEYAVRLQCRPARLDEGRVAVEIPFGPNIVNRGGRVHGGALASLLIAAARVSAAASEHAGSDRRVRLLAANFAFLSVPRHGRLVAEAGVVRRGREIAHMNAKAFDEGGATVANAAIAVGLVDSYTDEKVEAPHRTNAGTVDLAQGAAVSSSPYLSAAGVLILPPSERSARAVLPQVPNRAADPSRVDEGAIAGFADSCAAYAAHLQKPELGQRGGVTVSMGLAFHSSCDEDLVGVGAVTGHAAGCCLAVVDVAGALSGIPVASGFAVYRLPG
jgi:uncharacterized protein (TIGR00369 family)